MKKLIPEDPTERKQLLKKVAIVTAVVGGVVVVGVVIARLNKIEVEVETVLAIAEDVADAVEVVADNTDVLLP